MSVVILVAYEQLTRTQLAHTPPRLQQAGIIEETITLRCASVPPCTFQPDPADRHHTPRS
jgi:hypothetical protein